MSQANEAELIRRAKAVLDASLLELGASVKSRLDTARFDALEQFGDSQRTSLADPLIKKAREVLDSKIDSETAAKLDQMRAKAVNSRRENPAVGQVGSVSRYITAMFRLNSFSTPVRVFATTCVIVTVISLFTVFPDSATPLSLDEEISLIASADDLELYENLDFYMWLAENGLPN